MQIPNDRSTGQALTRSEHDDLLYCWMASLSLDFHTIERGYSKAFDTLKRRCASCGSREVCAVDLKRGRNDAAWEAYCPNSGALYALTALTEVLGVVRTPG